MVDLLTQVGMGDDEEANELWELIKKRKRLARDRMEVWHIFSTGLKGGKKRYAAVRVPRSIYVKGPPSPFDANWTDAGRMLPAWWHKRWYHQEGLCHDDCAVVSHCRPRKDIYVWTNYARDQNAWALGDEAQANEVFR